MDTTAIQKDIASHWIRVANHGFSGKKFDSRMPSDFLFGILLPIAMLFFLPWYYFTYKISLFIVLSFVAFYALTVLGLSVGYHRLTTHNSFVAKKPLEIFLILCGTFGHQGSALLWASEHRYHHLYPDSEKDPYGVHLGFWHAHRLWVVRRHHLKEMLHRFPDLWSNRLLRWQALYYGPLALVLNFVLPFLWGLIFDDPWRMLVYCGLFRIALSYELSSTINSFGHIRGQRKNDNLSATNNHLLALVTCGEGYHNFHHTFPNDYRFGYKWWHYDPGKWFVWVCQKLGFADKLKRTNRRQLENYERSFASLIS